MLLAIHFSGVFPLSGLETVKSLQMEPQLNASYSDYLAEYLRFGFSVRQIGNTYNVVSNGLEQMMALLILVVGGGLGRKRNRLRYLWFLWKVRHGATQNATTMVSSKKVLLQYSPGSTLPFNRVNNWFASWAELQGATVMNVSKRGLILLLAVLAVVVAAVLWYARWEVTSRRVDLTDLVGNTSEPKPEAVLRIAVAAMISPKETESSYFDLLRLIGKRLGRQVVFVQRKTYAEVNDLLEHREIDLAFVCAGPYVDGHERFGMELLAVPVVHGGTIYHSYFIVQRDGPIKDLKGLRGKRFAFTDPDSNSGYLVPTYVLSRRGETPESFFGKTFFTNSHDNSIKAVADNLADGAAVDSLIWEYINATKPADTARTRIIDKSPPYGIPPVVVHPALNPELKQKLREILLHLHEDPQAASLLGNIQIERFSAGNDAMYDSVRKMQNDLKAKR